MGGSTNTEPGGVPVEATPKLPTIAELETILAQEDQPKVRTLPDGQLTTEGEPDSDVPSPAKALRRSLGTGTPVTDGFRAWMKRASPEDLQRFADDMNGIAGGLRVIADGMQEKTKQSQSESDDMATGVIDFATFMKADLRVGAVIAAEWVPKSDKLLKLRISFGDLGERTILAGIAKSYTVEGIVGQSVVAVVNLSPRKMMGFESHGMLLAGQSSDGKVVLATCPGVTEGRRLS